MVPFPTMQPPIHPVDLMSSLPTLIVLAAGQGRRFAGDGHKLQAPLGAGTVLGSTLRAVVASGLPMLVVTRAPLLETAARVVDLRDIVVLSESEAARGMGHSIRAGVAERAGSSGWLVLPGDLPLVRPQTLQAVASALSSHPVVFAQVRGRRGHPVGFAPELFPELMQLEGDEGARRLLARYPVHGQEVDDPGALMDVDTVEDLDSVRQAWQTARVGPA